MNSPDFDHGDLFETKTLFSVTSVPLWCMQRMLRSAESKLNHDLDGLGLLLFSKLKRLLDLQKRESMGDHL